MQNQSFMFSELTQVPINQASGQVEAEEVAAVVKSNTCLVTIMMANNETGTVMVNADIHLSLLEH